MAHDVDPRDECVVIGGGPAGLTAAWELTRLGHHAHVLEAGDVVGGLSRTASYKGYRFDIGGHRFFTKVDEVQRLWERILGEEFLVRPRLSRIHYRGRLFDYPLRPWNALTGLGPVEAVRILLSYLRATLFPSREERTFEQWVSNRFGRRLYEIFFKTYTEKVWGMPCSEIGADWASQRIKNLDLAAALRHAVLGQRRGKGALAPSLIDAFHYPRHGPGQMWERCAEQLVEGGSRLSFGARVTGLRHDGRRVTAAVLAPVAPPGASDGTGSSDGSDAGAGPRVVPGAHFLCSMAIRDLIAALDPPPPPEVLAAGAALRYRDFLTVALVVDRADLFPDNWIYIHSADVRVGRVQNYKNWSPDMVPDPARTALGFEYFVQEGDELWSLPDDEMIALARRECDALGLAPAESVIDGVVLRVPKAYPVYDDAYAAALATIRGWLDGLGNLQLIGRNGQHRYNNQDHSMMTGLLAARNIDGASHDVWSVNVDSAYHEQGSAPDGDDAARAGGSSGSGDALPAPARGATGDRLVPSGAGGFDLAAAVRTAFAVYDPLALGVAVGAVAGLSLFLATVLALLASGAAPAPNLSLLGWYLLGYDVSWGGALLGLLEGALLGFGFGWLLARSINALVRREQRLLVRRLALASPVDLIEGDGR